MLQFITHPTPAMSLLQEIEKAIEGGCQWIQLRMKNADRTEIVETAKKAKELCKQHECILVIDDHADIAKELELDGVHLGKNDMPLAEAREFLGEGFIIGATANTFEDIEAIRHLDIDYIGLGPFRFTETKEKLSPVIGLDGYADIVSKKRASNIRIPIVAIGGIAYSDIQDIMDAGIDGIAVSGSLIKAPDMISETKKMITLLEKIKEQRYNS